jgi:hypothetical protein
MGSVTLCHFSLLTSQASFHIVFRHVVSGGWTASQRPLVALSQLDAGSSKPLLPPDWPGPFSLVISLCSVVLVNHSQEHICVECKNVEHPASESWTWGGPGMSTQLP